MYVKQSYSLLYYRKMKKMNSQGTVPIYCRLTIDGLRDEISCGVWINPDHGASNVPQFRQENYYFPLTIARTSNNPKLVENPGYN